ncbi:DUF6717 family protein [Pedobacter sp.]|uniref:DUF6717 family protein n=1 Tax=Pedobacter sp. TaxID=1411316 RepID=UPI0031DB5162
MKRNLKFYKTAHDEWFVDMPEWGGSLEDLQMIQGADDWLNLLNHGKKEVQLKLANEPFQHASFLTLIRLGEENLGGGANYFLETYQNEKVDLKIWLCDVVGFIFGDYPQRIYFEVI